MTDEELKEDKELYVFNSMIESIVPENGKHIEIKINGEIKNLSRIGKIFFLEDWGLTTSYGLFKYFKDLNNK